MRIPEQSPRHLAIRAFDAYSEAWYVNDEPQPESAAGYLPYIEKLALPVQIPGRLQVLADESKRLSEHPEEVAVIDWGTGDVAVPDDEMICEILGLAARVFGEAAANAAAAKA